MISRILIVTVTKAPVNFSYVIILFSSYPIDLSSCSLVQASVCKVSLLLLSVIFATTKITKATIISMITLRDIFDSNGKSYSLGEEIKLKMHGEKF
jgi:hypothetical protein